MYTDLCGETKLTLKSLHKQKATEDISVRKQTVKLSEEGSYL